MGILLAFPERKSIILYACVATPVYGFSEPQEGLLRVGPFTSFSKACDWEINFRVSCVYKNILVRILWIREATLPFTRRFDFNPATDDGMPWEVALSLLSFGFSHEQKQAAAWCQRA